MSEIGLQNKIIVSSETKVSPVSPVTDTKKSSPALLPEKPGDENKPSGFIQLNLKSDEAKISFDIIPAAIPSNTVSFSFIKPQIPENTNNEGTTFIDDIADIVNSGPVKIDKVSVPIPPVIGTTSPTRSATKINEPNNKNNDEISLGLKVPF